MTPILANQDLPRTVIELASEGIVNQESDLPHIRSIGSFPLLRRDVSREATAREARQHNADQAADCRQGLVC